MRIFYDPIACWKKFPHPQTDQPFRRMKMIKGGDNLNRYAHKWPFYGHAPISLALLIHFYSFAVRVSVKTMRKVFAQRCFSYRSGDFFTILSSQFIERKCSHFWRFEIGRIWSQTLKLLTVLSRDRRHKNLDRWKISEDLYLL